MAKFLVFKSTANSQYYFNLRDHYGQLLLQSEGYISHAGCLNGVQSVKTNSPVDANYNRLTAVDGSHYFTLKSFGNGEILGTSSMYQLYFHREDAIHKTKTQAPTAMVEDSTRRSSNY